MDLAEAEVDDDRAVRDEPDQKKQARPSTPPTGLESVKEATKKPRRMGTRIRSGPEGAPSYRQQARVATQQAQVQVRDMSRHHTT